LTLRWTGTGTGTNANTSIRALAGDICRILSTRGVAAQAMVASELGLLLAHLDHSCRQHRSLWNATGNELG